MRNKQARIFTGIIISSFLLGCYSYKHYSYRSKSRKIEYGYINLRKDTFALNFKKGETWISDRGKYEMKNGSILFHSFYSKIDTTFKRLLFLKFSRDYSEKPQTTTVFLANTSLEAMSHLSITNGDQHVLADTNLLPKSSCHITFPYVKGKMLAIKYNNVSYDYISREIIVLENRCDTTRITGPLFSSGTVKGKTITLSGSEVLNNKVYLFTK